MVVGATVPRGSVAAPFTSSLLSCALGISRSQDVHLFWQHSELGSCCCEDFAEDVANRVQVWLN